MSGSALLIIDMQQGLFADRLAAVRSFGVPIRPIPAAEVVFAG